MSLVRIIAIEPHDGKNPGDDYETTERQARQLEARGLAKMAVGVRNKMLSDPVNKANPSPAAGRAALLSASPVAPASQQTTAAPLKRGPGRPRKPESSQ